MPCTQPRRQVRSQLIPLVKTPPSSTKKKKKKSAQFYATKKYAVVTKTLIRSLGWGGEGEDARLWNRKENVTCSVCDYTINAEGGKKVKCTLNAIRKRTCKYLFYDKTNMFSKLFLDGISK